MPILARAEYWSNVLFFTACVCLLMAPGIFIL